MKKSVLLFMVILCISLFSFVSLVSLVSASYACSDGSSISEDIGEIDVGGKTTINGLGVGLIDADDIGVLKRFAAKLIVDAKKVILDNVTSSEDIQLLSGDYTVKLLNATDEKAIISIDGSSDTINEGEVGTIKSLKVFLFSAEGTYPKTTSVIVGKEEISLSNDENPSQIVTISKKGYVLELSSASNNAATVRIKKCESGNITEIAEIPDEDTSEENITSINETIANDTIINESVNETEAVEEECSVVGSREEDRYCAENKSLVIQKEKADSCVENYECKTNYCKSEKCVKLGIFERIILWFKNLFK